MFSNWFGIEFNDDGSISDAQLEQDAQLQMEGLGW